MKSSNRFLAKYFKKLPAGFLLLLMLISCAILLFTYIMHEVLFEKEVQFDNSVFDYISIHFSDHRLLRPMQVITYFASATFMQIAYSVLVVFYLIIKNFKRAVEIAVIGIGGFVLNYVMKLSFHRIRPPRPLIDPLLNFSFPSGHATSGFIFYGLLAYLVLKTNFHRVLKYLVAFLLISWSLVIGFSRIYLRVHYASDVLAGFCTGFAWLSLAIWLMEVLKKKSSREVASA
jgi:membrane-associated phospholipid phosphatase